MKTAPVSPLRLAAALVLGFSLVAPAQDGPPDFGGPPPGDFGGPPPPGFGGPGGRGGPGPMMQQERKLVKQYDQDGDGRLNAAERKAAREALAKEPTRGGWGGPGRGGRRGGPPWGGGAEVTPTPGPKMTPADAKNFPEAPLYDTGVVRTFFLEFEGADWEKELEEFHKTDVEVPAKVTVDGKVYPEVGVHFRGMSSYMMVREGQKRSLNLSFDWARKDQEIGGYRTLNFLNGHEDPSFLRAVLYLNAAREYLAAPRACFVRVVINGEYWGVYESVQQFNKEFTRESFGTTKGARWKAPGSPNGRGSLAYLGDERSAYEGIYDLKGKDDPKAWRDLIRLCRTLDQTPPAELEAALKPILDVDGALKFLALENALVNNDGYWVRTSDYGMFQDEKGVFHLLPLDANETFMTGGGPGGPGGPRGPGGPGGPGGAGQAERGGRPGGFGGPGRGGMMMGGGTDLDPLIAAEDARKPLISKLLAVPALRTRYLGYVRDIANRWLDWTKLEPVVRKYHDLVADAVHADTRKLESTEAFDRSLAGGEGAAAAGAGEGRFGGRSTMTLKAFADQRRAYLLKHPEIQKLK